MFVCLCDDDGDDIVVCGLLVVVCGLCVCRSTRVFGTTESGTNGVVVT